MEKEGILTRSRGKKDARQMIVNLTEAGKGLKGKLTNVPRTIASSVLCNSITEETIPGLFCMLDDIIHRLSEPVSVDKE